jgi:hypothetical protein
MTLNKASAPYGRDRSPSGPSVQRPAEPSPSCFFDKAERFCYGPPMRILTTLFILPSDHYPVAAVLQLPN